jgi:ABC-type glycerol-3-phosphate transport system substrate-binding protein
MINIKYSYKKMWLGLLLVLGIVIVFVVTTSCQSATEESAATTEVPTTATATRITDKTPTPVEPATVTPVSTPEGSPIELTFWTIEPISPLADEEVTAFFNRTINTFERSNPDVQVNVLVKKPSGKGGTLDFLRTAGGVAPSVLPDVVIINATDLTYATDDRLIRPLDGKLDRPIVQDLLPAARRVGTVDDELMGVPLGIEMEHTVNNTVIISGTPLLWTDILSNSSAYLFPARGTNGLVNDVSLSHYLSSGGSLTDDQAPPRPNLDEQPLNDVLSFYESLLEAQLIDDSLLDAATTGEVWPVYLNGGIGLSQVGVREYLIDRNKLVASVPAALPVAQVENAPVAIMHAWVLVLVAPDDDVVRQDAALRLMEAFLAVDTNADWNELNKSIPVRGASYQQLAGDDPYWQFLTTQLNTAQPEPRFEGYDRVGRIFQQAIEQVIRGKQRLRKPLKLRLTHWPNKYTILYTASSGVQCEGR